MTYSVILYEVRIKLGINLEEYCLCDMVFNLQARHQWCYATKRYFSELLNVSEKQVQRYISNCVDKGLLIRGDSLQLKTTDMWLKEAYLAGQEIPAPKKPGRKKGGTNMSPPQDNTVPPGGAKMSPIDNNIDNNIYSKETPSDLFGSKNDELKKKKSSSAARKIPFNESEFYEKEKFFGQFPGLENIVDLDYYWRAADNYSRQGNKYVDWISAITTWMSRDKANDKLVILKDKVADDKLLTDYLKM